MREIRIAIDSNTVAKLAERASDSEFFKREFGIIFVPVNPSDELDKSICGVYANSLVSWRQSLSRLRKKSLIFILGGNEYYDRTPLMELNSMDSIKAIFTTYLPRIRKIPHRELTKMIKLEPNVLRDVDFWKTSTRSWSALRRFRINGFSKPLVSIPLGYTNMFVWELMNFDLGIEKGESLFEISCSKIYGKQRKKSLCFVGQKGSWNRRQIVNSLLKDIEYLDQYGGWGPFTEREGSAYVGTLMEYWFSLCPPGNQSNESYRYYESTILGAIPIVQELSYQDWFIFDYWPREFGFDYLTIEMLMNKLRSLSDFELSEIAIKIRSREFSRIKKVKEQIYQFALD